MRYAYGISSALLVGGAAISLITGHPAGAQVTGDDSSSIHPVVPRAGAPASFADLTEQLQPAVVNISVRQLVQVEDPYYGFFGRRAPSTQEVQAAGSGFIISSDGYVVTNNHVIAADGRNAAEAIRVKLFDGREYEATLVGRDSQSDIAVLKISPDRPLPHVSFGDSATARAGDWVIAIGNPFGLGGTVTSGIISSPHRKTGRGAFDEFIQTDAAINSGNSGGPMFDMAGNVIGINDWIVSQSGGNIGIGFAIPAEVAKPIVEKIISGEEITRGYIGLLFAPLSDDVADALGLDHDRGEFVQAIAPGEPAALAGIQPGDIVLRIGGQAVTSDQSASSIIANTEPGAKIRFDLLREGKPTSLTVTVGKRPSDEELSKKTLDTGGGGRMPSSSSVPNDADTATVESLGLTVTTIDAEVARQLGGAADLKGVAVTDVSEGSNAALRGITSRVVIQSVNYEPVNTAADFAAKVEAARKAGRTSVLLFVIGPRGQSGYIPVRFKLTASMPAAAP
ncbi:MAG: protease [Proteobacteria bacterium]|nr:protease [Pseudomonadota bacterium]